MKAYELLYIQAPTTEDDAKATVAERIESTITSQSGKIDNVEDWGRRKLAYDIGELTDADYTLVEFTADEQSITELDRVLRISDAVIRHMITARPDKN
jgi:small subunit ribosomal protein S6